MASTSSSSSTLSHYRPAVLTVIGVAAASCLYLVYSSRQPLFATDPQSSSLHRSNAVRRPRRRNTDTAAHSGDGQGGETNAEPVDSSLELVGAADDATTELSLDDDPEANGQSADAQKLRELMYAISKNRAKNEGIVHRGVTCDNCNRVPIVGVRYHCSNCPDYDLCEDCEALDVHLKTHVFYKVKVPAPWGGKQPLPLWYPGKPHELPVELPQSVKKKISQETKCSGNKIDGYYTQWANLANTKWTDDPHGLGMAVDRAAFDRCFLPQMSNKKFPEPNLIHDQLFNFYDMDKNLLIGFEEFVKGTVLVHNKDRDARKRRVFQGLDLDNDNHISRRDLLRMFRAYYVLNKNIMLDYLKAERDGENAIHVVEHHSAKDVLESSRPLASYFSHGQPEFRSNPNHQVGKHVNEEGDLIPQSPQTSAILDRKDSHDHIDRQEVVARTWPEDYHMFEMDIRRVMEGRSPHWLSSDQAQSFNIPPAEAESGNLPAQKIIKSHSGKFWIAHRSFTDKTVFLRIKDTDSMHTFGKPVSWNAPPEDESFYHKMIDYVRRRVAREVGQKVKLKGFSRVMERSIYKEFHLDDENNDLLEPDRMQSNSAEPPHHHARRKMDFAGLESLIQEIEKAEGYGDSESKLNGVGKELSYNAEQPENAQIHGHAASGDDGAEDHLRENPLEDVEDDRSARQNVDLDDEEVRPFDERLARVAAKSAEPLRMKPTPLSATEENKNGHYVGGSAADQTIYEIMQQALNETFDPMFKPSESLALQVLDSKDDRQTHKKEINQWREAMDSIRVVIKSSGESQRKKVTKAKKKGGIQSGASEDSPSHSSSNRSPERTTVAEDHAEDLTLFRQTLEFKQSQLPLKTKFNSLGRPVMGLSLLVPREDQEAIFDDLYEMLVKIHPLLPSSHEYQVTMNEHSDDFYVAQDLRKSRVGGFCLIRRSTRLATVLVFLELKDSESDSNDDAMLGVIKGANGRNGKERLDDDISENIGDDPLPEREGQPSSSQEMNDEASAIDPTLPQNRPNVSPAPSSSRPKKGKDSADAGQTPNTRRIAELASLDEAAEKIKERGGPGKLNYEEFAEAIEATDEEGNKLLAWVGNWVDLVRF